MATEPTWGSPEWRTHLRRSLAQRKRHGEDIRDIEGLIDYIEEKGPGHAHPQVSTKKSNAKKAKSKTQTSQRRKVASTSKSKTPVAAQVGETGFYQAPKILRVGG